VRALGRVYGQRFTFDAAGREILRANLKPDGSALGVYTAGYDPIGNRLTVLDLDGTLVTHGYDALYRLVTDQRDGTYSFNRTYTYGEVGNRLTKSDSGALCTYGYDQADQLRRVGPWGSYPYPTVWSSDANGNLVTENYVGNISNYTWDTENRLTKLVQPSGYTEENKYSADGLRRVRLAGTSTITYLWDDHVLLRDNSIFTTLPGAPGGLLSAKVGGDHRFYIPDMQGHVRQVTDVDGDVIAEYQYDAWGLIQLTAASAMAFADWGYTWDGKPGRYYVEQRHLRADLGRWMSVDPVETEPPYAYVGNRPTWAVDPSGGQGRPGLADFVWCTETQRWEPVSPAALGAAGTHRFYVLELPSLLGKPYRDVMAALGQAPAALRMSAQDWQGIPFALRAEIAEEAGATQPVWRWLDRTKDVLNPPRASMRRDSHAPGVPITDDLIRRMRGISVRDWEIRSILDPEAPRTHAPNTDFPILKLLGGELNRVVSFLNPGMQLRYLVDTEHPRSYSDLTGTSMWANIAPRYYAYAQGTGFGPGVARSAMEFTEPATVITFAVTRYIPVPAGAATALGAVGVATQAPEILQRARSGDVAGAAGEVLVPVVLLITGRVCDIEAADTVAARQTIDRALASAKVRVAKQTGLVEGQKGYGSALHHELDSQIRALAGRNIRAELSYRSGKVVDWSDAGCVRLDVVIGRKIRLFVKVWPKQVLDLKTGRAHLTPARIAQIRRNLPLYGQLSPILEIRP